MRIELDRTKQRVEELQDINDNLEARLRNGNNDTDDGGNPTESAEETSMMLSFFKIKFSAARIEALENELSELAKRSASTVSMLKIKLSRKVCNFKNK